MRNLLHVALAVFAILILPAFAEQPYPAFGNISKTNFLDDTIQVRYKSGTNDTSAILGWSAAHRNGPDLALWKTLFVEITPDSVDSVAVMDCKFVIREFDFNPVTQESVFTACADTAVDTITITGTAGDSSWTKYSFQPNPCNGIQVITISQAGNSSVMYSTAKFWLHQVKKMGVFQ